MINKIYNKDLIESISSIKKHIQKSLQDLTDQSAGGIFYLIKCEDEYVAMGGLRRLNDEICELKRMYVKPNFRRRGIGTGIIDHLEKKAKEKGFLKIRLDTTEFMKSAYNLYRAAGFYEIDSYPESEGLDMQPLGLKIIFMEKTILK